MLQFALFVEEAQQQRTDQRAITFLVPAKSCYHAIAVALMLDLEHRALVWLVCPFDGLGHHAVKSRAFKAAKPICRQGVIPGRRCQVNRRRDGRKLFFISPDKSMMVVTFDPETGTAGAPQKIFKTHIVAKNFAGTQYDVAPDGRFLIHSLPADYGSPLTVLTNWPKRCD